MSCRSGKKYKKCCLISDDEKKAITSAASAASATSTVVDRQSPTTTMVCYHESDEEHFVKGSEYEMIVDAWLSVLNKGGTTEYDNLSTNFETTYENVLKDSDFVGYIFAITTEMFRKYYKTEEYSSSKVKLQQILFLGITSKYVYSPLSADVEKYEKYARDIHTVRGIINCLYRETQKKCDCMKPFKMEATKMEKVGKCLGCNKDFPKTELKRCIRCDCVQYCSKECQQENWPLHKKYCINNNTNQ